MPFSIVYRRLFEVEILHGWHLNKGDREEFFDFNKENKKLALQGYSLLNDLVVLPTRKTTAILEGQKMKFKQTPNGFLVGIEVRETGVPGNFTPRITLNAGTRLVFTLHIKNPLWNNFSNLRLQHNLPAVFYLTNRNDAGNKQFPVLSSPVPVYVAGDTYPMGDLVLFGGSLFEAKRNTSALPDDPSPDWKLISNHHFLTEADRSIIPAREMTEQIPLDAPVDPGVVKYSVEARFPFFFPPAIADTQVAFSLKDENGDEKYRKTVSSTVPLRRHDLHLGKKDPSAAVNEKLQPGWYDLEVSGNAGFSFQKKLLLDPDILEESSTQPSLFAVIEIAHENNLGDFRLLEPSGELRADEDDFDRKQPVFQILIKNRSTYWQYLLPEGQEVLLGAGQPFALSNNGVQKITTRNPMPLTRMSSRLHISLVPIDPPGADPYEKFLPNPSPFSVREDDTRLYSEVYVSKKDISP
jgi:hypothetical protein